VGTSQYMAPEVIRGELYDGRCDWWSVGIIMFEVSTLLSSQPSYADIATVPLRLDSVCWGGQSGYEEQNSSWYIYLCGNLH